MEFLIEHIFKVIFQCLYFVYCQLSLFAWVLIGCFMLFFFMLLCFATHYLNNEIREMELYQSRRCTRKNINCKQVSLVELENKNFQFGFGVVDPKTNHINTRQLLQEIHFAASRSPNAQWTERCIELLKYYPKAVNHIMLPQKFTPFLRACLCGGTSLVKYMLYNGADTSLTTADGDTAMMLAVHSVSQGLHDLSLLELLVQFGCNINTPKQNGCTPLHMAAKSGNVTLIRWLINNGASSAARSNQGWTPAHVARELGHDEAANSLSLTAQFRDSRLIQVEMLNALYTKH